MDEVKRLGVLEAIFQRRSVRSYTGQKVDEETIRTLLRAAVHAPTAIDLEPWAFVVVQDGPTLRRYSDRAKVALAATLEKERNRSVVVSIPESSAHLERFLRTDFNIFYDAGTLIAICGRSLGQFVIADCWLAAENLMLAACALGLGTCCIGSAIPVLNAPDVKAELAIPPDVAAIAPIIVGVPRGITPSMPRNEPELLCWN